MKPLLFNKQLLKFILMFYFLASALGVLSAVLVRLNGFNTSFSWSRIIFSNIFNLTSKFVFLFLAILFTKYLISKKISILYSILIHTFLSILLSFYSTTMNTCLNKFVYQDAIDLNWQYIYIRSIANSGFNFFVYFSLITMVYAFYYFQNQKDSEIRRSNLTAQLLDSKIKALQSQLNPHFLFNSLNDISSLMDISVSRSQDAIADLSSLLRQTLNLKDVRYITLEKEIELLSKYIDIEKIRFADKIIHTIKIDPNISHNLVPPLMIQPIVENSIKHGFSYNHDIVKIEVIIKSNDNQLIFYIKNNGELLEHDENINYGTGLSNVLERLNTLYGNKFTFEMENSNNWVVTKIIIPKILQE